MNHGLLQNRLILGYYAESRKELLQEAVDVNIKIDRLSKNQLYLLRIIVLTEKIFHECCTLSRNKILDTL